MSNLNANTLIDLLFIHFNVTTMADLAMHINVSQQTISKWKQRNSVNAIKKKCIELGIYNEIFGDLNNTINITSEVNQAIKEKNEVDTDETTLFLFKEAYQKAKNSNNIKGLRIYLMDFDEVKEVEKLTINEFKDLFENMKTKSK